MQKTIMEKTILSCMILSYIQKTNYQVINNVINQLEDDDFNYINKKIFIAIKKLTKEKAPVNNITITNEAKDIQASYLSELFKNYEQLATYSNYQYYIDELKKKNTEILIKNAKDTEEVKDILKEQKQKTNIQTVNYEDALNDAIAENKQTKDIMNYGYQFLDNRLGGMQKGELLLVGGITGTGKSTFSTKVALNSAKKSKKVVIVSFEERIVQRARKEIYYYCNRQRKIRGEHTFRMIDYLNNKKRFTEEEEKEAKAFLNSKIQYVKCNNRISTNQIKDIFDLNADLYVFDHLHYFGIETGNESKANKIEEAMQEIKDLTVKKETRTILVAHFKKLDESKRPTMTDFKDSISIAQTADTILLLWRDKSKDSLSQYETEFICPKNRIDEPSFTSIANFDILTNDYLKETDYSVGTTNSEVVNTAQRLFS